MKKKVIFSLFASLASLLLIAQEKNNNAFSIKTGGFIKSDFFYDSRQTFAAREGHFLLWPEKPSLDNDNKDVNDVSNFNFLSIQTRLNLTITAPDAFGAKTSGLIEGAFFGHSNHDINGFRLRHAIVKFEWEKYELLLGQFWNPLFVTSSFPDVISFNTGCPFQPFSRNPQVRFTFTTGNIKFISALLSQRDFASTCPSGASASYLRNATLPDIHLQAHYTLHDQNSGTQLIFGGGTAYKKIVPELITTSGYKTNASVAGISYMTFAKAKLLPLTIKAQYVLGQNVTDLLMIGGYGVSQITDPEKGLVKYTPLRTSSYWIDLHSNKEKIQVGCFFGISENQGSVKNLVEETDVTGLGTDIKSLYRIAPRLIFNSGKARFAIECEYSGANFGSVNIVENRKGIPVNFTEVTNLRLLLGVYLFL